MNTQEEVDKFVLFCQARGIQVLEDPERVGFILFKIEDLLPYIEEAIKEFPLLSSVFTKEDPPKPGPSSGQ
jgi:hypothetical protein